MTTTTINYLELFSVLSNLFILIPFVRSVEYHLIFAAFLTFIETWVSLFYHLCDFSNVCIFPFRALRYLDFFFAQYFIIYLSVYIVDWTKKWIWLQWTLLFIGGFIIVILQILLPGELFVQAGIAFICFACIVLYWVVYARTVGNGRLPPYNWANMAIGIGFLGLSVIMFVIQNTAWEIYWATHSIWHISAAIGFDFIIRTKSPAEKYSNVASRIG